MLNRVKIADEKLARQFAAPPILICINFKESKNWKGKLTANSQSTILDWFGSSIHGKATGLDDNLKKMLL